jgi:hypothetical protein
MKKFCGFQKGAMHFCSFFMQFYLLELWYANLHFSNFMFVVVNEKLDDVLGWLCVCMW